MIPTSDTRPEPRRDRYGRYLITPHDGGKPKSYTRATTFAETLDDRYNLELWKLRQTAVGLAGRPDLIAQIAAHGPDDKKVLNQVCRDAMDAAASSSAANLGTALHRATEAADLGEPVADMFTERVGLYTAALNDAGLTVLPDHVEQVVVNEPYGVAGTLDRIVTHNGRNYIADLKTGRSVEWGAGGYAVQLALYATATSYYDYATDTHSTPPDVDTDRALIIHLPAAGGPCTIWWLDITAGREACEHARWVRGWRRRRDLLTPVTAPPDPDQLELEPTPAPRPQNIIPPLNPTPTHPDEGDTGPHWTQRVRDGYAALNLNPTAEARIVEWVSEGSRSGHPWRITEHPTERRYHLYRLAARLAVWADHNDDAQLLLGTVTTITPVGAAIGSLTTDQTKALITLTDMIDKGTRTLSIDADGNAVIDAA